jgi:hypothetical protein
MGKFALLPTTASCLLLMTVSLEGVEAQTLREPSDVLSYGNSIPDLSSPLPLEMRRRAAAQNASLVDANWIKIQSLSPAVRRQLEQLDDATETALKLITSGDLMLGSASAFVRAADVASLIDEHTVHVKVNFDHRPIGGILNVQVSMTPSFRGIGISSRPTISKSVAQATDMLDENAVRSMVKALTAEIKAEFARYESENSKN